MSRRIREQAAIPVAVEDTVTVTGGLTDTELRASPISISSAGVTLSATPTITAGAYSANDAVGQLLELENAARIAGGGGIITNVSLRDSAGQNAEVQFWFFSEAITDTSDNDPFTLSDTDIDKRVGIIFSTDGEYAAVGTKSVLDIKDTLRFDLVAGGTSLYLKIVTRGTPTYTATDNLNVHVGILQD